MPKPRKRTWNLEVPTRFDTLTKKATEAGCYSTKAEFVRAAVKELAASFETLLEPINNEDDEWNIAVTPQLDTLAAKLVATGAFKSKAEMIRYAVRVKVKLQLAGCKL